MVLNKHTATPGKLRTWFSVQQENCDLCYFFLLFLYYAYSEISIYSIKCIYFKTLNNFPSNQVLHIVKYVYTINNFLVCHRTTATFNIVLQIPKALEPLICIPMWIYRSLKTVVEASSWKSQHLMMSERNKEETVGVPELAKDLIPEAPVLGLFQHRWIMRSLLHTYRIDVYLGCALFQIT